MDNNSVKKNIEDIRKELGFSQQTMAEKLCITRNAYRRIEKGQTRVIHDVIPRIADLSGHTVEEICLGYQPFASYDVALQDEHTRYTAHLETLKSEYESRIQSLVAENSHLTRVLGMAESEISTLKSFVSILQKEHQSAEK